MLIVLKLVELRQPPVSASEPTGLGTVDGSYALNGILGSILGESPADQGLRLEEASRGAKDLTSLVKRKRPAGNESSRCAEETESHEREKEDRCRGRSQRDGQWKESQKLRRR